MWTPAARGIMERDRVTRWTNVRLASAAFMTLILLGSCGGGPHPLAASQITGDRIAHASVDRKGTLLILQFKDSPCEHTTLQSVREARERVVVEVDVAVPRTQQQCLLRIELKTIDVRLEHPLEERHVDVKAKVINE